jgi:hypothetical protein
MNTYEYVYSLGYNNVQSYINNGPRGTIDVDRFRNVYEHMKSVGWREISVKDLNKDTSLLEPRYLIKYITNNNPKEGGIKPIERDSSGKETLVEYGSSAQKFRSGGWLISINEGDNGKYLLYRPHNNKLPVSVQLNNILKLFVLDSESQDNLKEERRKKKPVYFNKLGEKTNYPVYVIDKDGNKTIVYYAVSQSKAERFMQTNKYLRALENGWEFK